MSPEFIALLRVMLENNANVQAAIMRSLLERPQQPQESALGEVVRGVLVPLIEKQQQPPQQNPLEMVKEIVPLIRGNADSNKSGGANFERGIERGLQIGRTLGVGAPPSDNFGEVAQLLTLFKSATSSTSQPQAAPPPPPPPAQPVYGYPMAPSPTPPAMPWDGWEWVQTPMGIMMRPIPHAPMPPMPVQYAPPQATPMSPPAPAPVQYAPVQTHAPMPPPAPPEPVHVQPLPVQQAPAPVAPVQSGPRPVSPEPPAQVPFISNPAPIPFEPPIVPLRQPVSPSSTPNAPPNVPVTESNPVTEFVARRRTPKGAAPYLTAAGFVNRPPDDPLDAAPDNPLAFALGNGAALLRDPEFLQKASAFMAGDLSPDKLAELLAAAEKAGVG